MIKYKFNDLPCGTVFSTSFSDYNTFTYVKIFDAIEDTDVITSFVNAYNTEKNCYAKVPANHMCEIVSINRGSIFSRIPVSNFQEEYMEFKDLPNGTIFAEIEELNAYSVMYRSYVKFDICSGENIPYNDIGTCDANAVSTVGFVHFNFHKNYPCKVISFPHYRNIK